MANAVAIVLLAPFLFIELREGRYGSAAFTGGVIAVNAACILAG